MMEMLHEWLALPPKYTTFRINKLKNFDIDVLETFLKAQAKELGMITLPKYYYSRPDCLVLEQWPKDVNMTQTNKEVIVDAHCAAAVLRGSHVFAPGVMGLPSNCQLEEKIDIYGDLEGHCKRGLKVKYNGKKIFVGIGILKMLRMDLFDNGIQPSGIAVETILPASRLPVAIIIAIDKTPVKAEKIKESCKKQGVDCVTAYAFDSTKCFDPNASGIEFGPPFAANCFDKILLDAPCSGLGQRPQLANKMTPKMLESYKFVQRKLISAAVEILKVGGKLVYSTCTVTIEENEGMVLWALEKFPCLKLIPAQPLRGGPGLQDSGLSEEQRKMVQRFSPVEDHLRPVEEIYRDTIGFFIAAFTKIDLLKA